MARKIAPGPASHLGRLALHLSSCITARTVGGVQPCTSRCVRCRRRARFHRQASRFSRSRSGIRFPDWRWRDRPPLFAATTARLARVRLVRSGARRRPGGCSWPWTGARALGPAPLVGRHRHHAGPRWALAAREDPAAFEAAGGPVTGVGRWTRAHGCQRKQMAQAAAAEASNGVARLKHHCGPCVATLLSCLLHTCPRSHLLPLPLRRFARLASALASGSHFRRRAKTPPKASLRILRSDAGLSECASRSGDLR